MDAFDSPVGTRYSKNRRQDSTSTSNNNAVDVAHHYNARPQGSVRDRKHSPIYMMKSFNNAIKTILINRYTRPRDVVLDFGCGKGGDLQKWDRARVGYLVGLDIASVSIEHARQRYAELKRRSPLRAEFHAADLFVEDIDSLVDKEMMFNVVSCQFMLHYCFESETKVRTCFANIAKRTKPGGTFVGTIPNGDVLVKRLKMAEGLEFGNDIYNIKFEQKDKFTKYGHKYHFYLKDAIDDCPEYLMHFPTFKRIVEGFGFKLLFAEPFHDFYRNMNYPKCRELFNRMKLSGPHGNLSDDEWEATGLYLAFAFQKL